MKALYKIDLHLHYANATGLFIEDKEKVEWLLETKPEIYFGEISGKHSEVFGALDKDDIQMITDDPDDLKVVERLHLEHGINPFWYPTGDYKTVMDMYNNLVTCTYDSDHLALIKTYEQTN
jgi:hypothetical protein